MPPLSAHLRALARVLGAVVGVALIAGAAVRARPSQPYRPKDAELTWGQAARVNVARFAEGAYGLRVDPRDVVLLDAKRGLGLTHAMAILLGKAPKGRPDPGGGFFDEVDQAGGGPGGNGDQGGGSGPGDSTAAPGALGPGDSVGASGTEADGGADDPSEPGEPGAPPAPPAAVAAPAKAPAGHHPARDVYFLEVRLSAAGIPLSGRLLTNLSRTRSADERLLTARGRRVAFAGHIGGHYETVSIIDYNGEDPKLTADWGTIGKLQNGITNLQETGRMAGANRRTLRFVRAPSELKLTWLDRDRLAVDYGYPPRAGDQPGPGNGDRGRLILHASTGALLEASGKPHRGELAESKQLGKGRRELLQWAVDTVRNTSFIGPRPIEWMEAKWFALVDTYRRTRSSMRRGDTTATAKEIAQEMGVGGPVATLGHHDPALDERYRGYVWPPPPLSPIVKNPIKGEGEWIVPSDEFVTQPKGRPPLFAQTFLRPDPARADFSRVYIIAWDPRQLSLDMVAGTREPLSATGALGSGMIPRQKGVIDNVVAAFNGGFQALHGEFGMMAQGTVYLEPKPYAATIAALAGGDTGLGTWGPDTDTIPPEIRSYRQNLTPLVEDGVANPFKRGWWGGAPPGAPSPTHTVRTGLCLTQENYLAYFWGTSLDQHGLARTMNAARCAYGVHLDMNTGHAGFEFLKILPSATAKVDPSKFEKNFKIAGPVSGRPDLTFFCRRLIRGMGLMHFPRYIKRDPRDFMFLTLRKILPGDDIKPLSAQPGEGKWITAGLPQGGQPFPPLLARTFLVETAPGVGESKVSLLKLDASQWDWRLINGSAEPVPAPPGRGISSDEQKVPVGPPALRIGLGLSDPGHPVGQVIDGKVVVPPRPGQPVLAVLKERRAGQPRVTIGAWNEEIRLADVIDARQGTPLTHDLPPKYGGLVRRYAAVGVDADGNVLYATTRSLDPGALGRALGRAGAVRMMLLDHGKAQGSLFVAAQDGAGQATPVGAGPVADGNGAAGGSGGGATPRNGAPSDPRWMALPDDPSPPLEGASRFDLRPARRPGGVRLFPEVKPVSPNVWYAIQSKRHRYFRAKDGGVIIRGVPGKR